MTTPPASGASRGAEAMEDALALLAETGPEYHAGLANHGPMAAEALVALGRFDAVVPWVERYRRRLDARPSGSRPIGDDWKEALGVPARVADWSAYFGRLVAEAPWRDVLAAWVSRLSPGIFAAAFHGAIRTAHAARSLEAVETPARRRELGEGLAYWAANFHSFPETRGDERTGRLPARALADVPLVPAADQVAHGDLTDRIAPVERLRPFAAVADLADPSGDASAFLSDLTATFAGAFRASVPPGNLIAFVHGVTGPGAVRLLLPYVDAASGREALRYAWQGAAALYSGFSGRPPGPPGTAAPEPAALVDAAVATGDEHAIKFTEVCLRENALAPAPVYLEAAGHAVRLFG